jgi:hypothetical protein
VKCLRRKKEFRLICLKLPIDVEKHSNSETRMPLIIWRISIVTATELRKTLCSWRRERMLNVCERQFWVDIPFWKTKLIDSESQLIENKEQVKLWKWWTAVSITTGTRIAPLVSTIETRQKKLMDWN